MTISLTDDGTLRQFSTGATRDTAQNKLDYEGFLSPFALEAYAEYMHRHRLQSDGKLRDSDNWQKGFPTEVIVKSAWRHLFAWWKIHRGGHVQDDKDGHEVSETEAICGVIFNAMARLHAIHNEATKHGEPQ